MIIIGINYTNIHCAFDIWICSQHITLPGYVYNVCLAWLYAIYTIVSSLRYLTPHPPTTLLPRHKPGTSAAVMDCSLWYGVFCQTAPFFLLFLSFVGSSFLLLFRLLCIRFSVCFTDFRNKGPWHWIFTGAENASSESWAFKRWHFVSSHPAATEN